MKRIPLCAAAGGALFLLASSAITVAQEPPADATTPPVETSPAPASPQNEAAAPSDSKTANTPGSECKGLAEKPCRKNRVCTWIIPKEPNKSGQVPPAYCRKLGPKKKDAAAAPNTPPPAQEPAPPAAAHPED